MNTPQTAILPPANVSALFITLMLSNSPSARQNCRAPLRALPATIREMASAHEDASLCGLVGIGAGAWEPLFGSTPPPGLGAFPTLKSDFAAPSTPTDLFIHIHSGRPDLNYELGRRLLASFGDAVSVVEEVPAFRYLDGRDMTGFVDGTENPQGNERASVALTHQGEHAGGSYVFTQRYQHKLASWETLTEAEQEKVIGRTKPNDIELVGKAKPPTAHISRVVIKEDGEELEILRHSMPYGTPSTSGLYFVAYCNDPQIPRRMLRRMHGLDPASAGVHDHLLHYTTALTGAEYFAPSIEFLEQS